MKFDFLLNGRFFVFDDTSRKDSIIAGRSLPFVDDQIYLLYITDKLSEILFKIISTS